MGEAANLSNALRFSHLSKSPLLQDLSEDQKSRFLNECSVTFYPTETEVLTQGKIPDAILMVAHGQLIVRFEIEEGYEAIIHHCGPGDAVGDVEAVAEEVCVATCLTAPNTTLLACPIPVFFEFMKQRIFMRNVARLSYFRLARDNVFKSIDLFMSVDQRVLNRLVEQSVKKPIIAQSQAQIAQQAGCSRQTVNKILGGLKEKGVIEIRKGAIEVLDREALVQQIEIARDKFE